MDEGTQLEPCDQGYRDGWADRNNPRSGRPTKRRRKRRAKSPEYALGYGHGWTDSAQHPGYPKWWPDFATGRIFSRSSRENMAPLRAEVAA